MATYGQQAPGDQVQNWYRPSQPAQPQQQPAQPQGYLRQYRQPAQPYGTGFVPPAWGGQQTMYEDQRQMEYQKQMAMRRALMQRQAGDSGAMPLMPERGVPEYGRGFVPPAWGGQPGQDPYNIQGGPDWYRGGPAQPPPQGWEAMGQPGQNPYELDRGRLDWYTGGPAQPPPQGWEAMGQPENPWAGVGAQHREMHPARRRALGMDVPPQQMGQPGQPVDLRSMAKFGQAGAQMGISTQAMQGALNSRYGQQPTHPGYREYTPSRSSIGGQHSTGQERVAREQSTMGGYRPETAGAIQGPRAQYKPKPQSLALRRPGHFGTTAESKSPYGGANAVRRY